MSLVDKTAVEQALATCNDRYTGKDLVAGKNVRDIRIDGGAVEVDLQFGYPCKGIEQEIRSDVESRLLAVDGIEKATASVATKVVARSVQHGVKRLENVKNIIAVASGKGGVGKSTTSVNLALALSVEGAKVGLLDADIYGPSQPRMMGLSGQPESSDGKSIEPMRNYDVETMSIGFLIDEETPMIWRGPMVTQALEQLLNDTNWGDLDYLIIDLPPGTGDTQLTLSQKVPVSGAVIVTTPQDIALLDARKGGGGGRMASDYDIDLLGSLPLDMSIREQVDGGKPTVVSDPEGVISLKYREIARKTAAGLVSQAKDYSAAFPNIVIQST